MIKYSKSGRIYVIVNAGARPTDLEWDEMLYNLNCNDPENRILIYTEGSVPTISQRIRAYSVMNPQVKIAVLTTSPMARMVALAMSLFNNSIKTFSPNDIYIATFYLNLSIEETKNVAKELSDLFSLCKIKKDVIH